MSDLEKVLSGQTLEAVYTVAAKAKDIEDKARALCVEQTVEFPPELIDRQDILEGIVARVASIEEVAPGRFRVKVAFAAETAGRELTQLLNVLMGNISLQPGVRLETFELPGAMFEHYDGARYGREGLRRLVRAAEGPLLASALKPMGLSAFELSDLAFDLAAGGMHFIKDDHGLSDQPFCRFEDRVEACAEAVSRANAQTGGHTLYLPNVTGPFDEMADRAERAVSLGAGGFVVSPGLCGFDAMGYLARNPAFGKPVFCHPALLGGFCVNRDSGISHGALYGRIARLAGADAVIFPNYGGRFSFSKADCREIVEDTAAPMGPLRKSFPVPAGGMTLKRVSELSSFYGDDVILLIGGDLHRGESLIDTCRAFARAARALG